MNKKKIKNYFLLKKCTFRVKNEKKFVFVTQKFVFIAEITNVHFCNLKVCFCNPVFDLGYKNKPFWVTRKNISEKLLQFFFPQISLELLSIKHS